MIRLAVAVGVMTLAACGSEPSAPLAPSLPPNPRLSAGAYYLTVRALPGFQGCTGAWTNAPASRVVRLILAEQNGEWLAQPDSAAAGDVVLRMQEAATGAITGTIRGQLVTARSADGAVSLGVSFGAGALVIGTALDDLDMAFGRIEGGLTFVDQQQAAPMRCGAGEWTLSPALL